MEERDSLTNNGNGGGLRKRSASIHSPSIHPKVGRGRRASINGQESQFSKKMLETALNQNPEVYRSLKHLEEARMQPLAFETNSATAMEMQMKDLKAELVAVKNEVRVVQTEMAKEMAAMQRNLLKVLIERTPDPCQNGSKDGGAVR